jgi:hypothetical protein
MITQAMIMIGKGTTTVWLKTQTGTLLNLAEHHKIAKRRFTDWQTNQEAWNVVAERFIHSQPEDLTEAEVLARVPSGAEADAILGRISEAMATNRDFLDLTNTF